MKRNSAGEWRKRVKGEQDVDDDACGVSMGDRSANIAFSAGARNCVGQALAMRMVPMILATVLRSFEFCLCNPDYRLRLERYGASQVPKGGIPMVIKLRESRL